MLTDEAGLAMTDVSATDFDFLPFVKLVSLKKVNFSAICAVSSRASVRAFVHEVLWLVVCLRIEIVSEGRTSERLKSTASIR